MLSLSLIRFLKIILETRCLIFGDKKKIIRLCSIIVPYLYFQLYFLIRLLKSIKISYGDAYTFSWLLWEIFTLFCKLGITLRKYLPCFKRFYSRRTQLTYFLVLIFEGKRTVKRVPYLSFRRLAAFHTGLLKCFREFKDVL